MNGMSLLEFTFELMTIIYHFPKKNGVWGFNWVFCLSGKHQGNTLTCLLSCCHIGRAILPYGERVELKTYYIMLEICILPSLMFFTGCRATHWLWDCRWMVWLWMLSWTMCLWMLPKKHLDKCRCPPFVCWFWSGPSMQAAAAPSTQLDDLSQNTPWLKEIKAGCFWLANCFDNKFKQLVSGNISENMDHWEKTITTIKPAEAAQTCCCDAEFYIFSELLSTNFPFFPSSPGCAASIQRHDSKP